MCKGVYVGSFILGHKSIWIGVEAEFVLDKLGMGVTKLMHVANFVTFPMTFPQRK